MAKGDVYDKLPDAVDPGEPGYRPPANSGFTVERAVDPGEPTSGEPEGVPSEETGDAEAGGEEEGLEFPEGTVLLYDEEGNPFLGIPIDPSDVPEDPEE